VSASQKFAQADKTLSYSNTKIAKVGDRPVARAEFDEFFVIV